MREQEYSSPGREYSQPGTEFAPAGQAFQRGEGEYFPQVPELANAQEATDVSGQLGRPRRKKRAGRGGGIIRQAAAAVAIGAVTVTTVVAAGGDLPGFNWDRYDRDTQYIYTEFTDEQRDYLDRALELMEDGDDLAVEALLGDEGETFD